MYIISFIEGYVATQILDRAITNGNLTRAGVLAAANSITADLKGLAPNQTWRGNPNNNVVRETYLYDVDLSLYTPGVTVSEEGGNNGFRLIKGPLRLRDRPELGVRALLQGLIAASCS